MASPTQHCRYSSSHGAPPCLQVAGVCLCTIQVPAATSGHT